VHPPAFCFFTERFEAYRQSYCQKFGSALMPDSHSARVKPDHAAHWRLTGFHDGSRQPVCRPPAIMQRWRALRWPGLRRLDSPQIPRAAVASGDSGKAIRAMRPTWHSFRVQDICPRPFGAGVLACFDP
jgi:hypothetical protein